MQEDKRRRPAASASSDTELARRLLGAWSLVSWTIDYPATGRRTTPFGTDAEGLLIYSADGQMSATMQRRDRPPLSRANLAQVPDAEKSVAFGSHLHYAGEWSVQSGCVMHSVRLATNPNMLGTVQQRSIAFDGEQLVLGAEEPLEEPGALRRHRLVWTRIASR